MMLLLLRVPWWGAAAGPGAGRSGVGRVGLLASGRISIGDYTIAGHPEPGFIGTAVGVIAGNPVSARVSTAFVVGFEATLILQGGAVLPKLQAGDG